MPVFPSQNLYSQKICETYDRLLQIHSGSLVLDGSGSQKQYLNVTASYALNCNCASGSGTSLYTGSTYPITSSWSLNSLHSITASYANNFGRSITQSFSASLLWTFQHNLDDKYVIIQTVDENDNQLIPELINLYDNNTSIIAFSVPTSGTAIATKGGVRIFSSSYGYYNLLTGSTYPITSSWSEKSVYSVTASYLINSDSVVQCFTGSNMWIFTHSLDSRPVVIQAYDRYYNQLIPETIYLYNKDIAILGFSNPETGCAIATRSGLTRTTIISSSLTTGSIYPITSSYSLTTSYVAVKNVDFSIKRITGSYNVVLNDYTILCDATSGSFNVVLPDTSNHTQIFNIKKIDRSGHQIHVYTVGAKYIDYDLTQSISHKGTNMNIQSDKSQYWIL